ncbi:glycoside-pentoside-hexuronide (GPH):cation symporter [Algibacillus agarilyticus]|uniref:glycoside-pentoside-hexuronide (GPH):cation symporter n=1 Tax=Algibacillus agarilyticus TaxID=2234133 RepID=UPI000DCFB9E8|nr:glycoside-pentoside-hexuronide (GPH):cation symporter [Algibacillus agarilyticus]
MVSVKEKIAYGLGDTASNIIFQTVMLFLTYFYTDIFGLAPAVVGTLFLVVRVFDAITDPLMGALTDRTKTRWGSFRPYILWLCVPFALISVLAFTTPDLSDSGKIIYAYITYTLLMMVYTAVNIPYCALGGVITANVDERVSVQSYRFVFAMLGGIIVSAFTLPLVEYFGQGDKALGYQLTIGAMSLMGLVMFLICFMGTKERIAVPADQNTNIKQDLKELWKNDQWRVLFIVGAVLLTGMVLRNTLAIFYVKYYLGLEDFITTFITIGMVGNIIGCALAQPLAKRVNKIKAYIVLQLIAAVICVASFFVAPDQSYLAAAMFFFWGFFINMGTPLLWSKMADTVDYGQWKSGVRITGMVHSSVIFSIKLGVAFGGAIGGWLLAYYGYQADVKQSTETMTGIALSFTIFPAIGSILVALLMRGYTLDSAKLKQIQADLKLQEHPALKLKQ